MYYDDYMKNMDYLYYAGDDDRAKFPHYVGGAKQDNPVHIVEVLGAMSIVDFSKQVNQDNIVYKEPILGITEDANNGNPTICNVSSIRDREIKRALVKFQLMREFFVNESEGFLKHGIDNRHAYAKDIQFTEDMRKACVGVEPTKVYADVNEMANKVENETKNFQYAWGLNAFFKEWVAWWNDLSRDDVARRKFYLFPNAASDINQNNVTQKFFAAGGYGIAKTEEKKKGFFKTEVVTEVLYPNISTNVLKAHDSLKWTSVPEDKKLAALLKTISDGLDKTLEKTCNV